VIHVSKNINTINKDLLKDMQGRQEFEKPKSIY